MRTTDLLRGAVLPGTEGLNAWGYDAPDPGLAAIRAQDPAFDPASLVAHAQEAFAAVQHGWTTGDLGPAHRFLGAGIWQQHRIALQQLKASGATHVAAVQLTNAQLVAASAGPQVDTVVVRMTVSGTSEDVAPGQHPHAKPEVWVEDWIFQRARGTTTQASGGLVADRCPSCGAPVRLDETGSCAYCHQPVTSGAYDWVLTAVHEPASSPVSSVGLVGFFQSLQALQQASMAQAAAVGWQPGLPPHTPAPMPPLPMAGGVTIRRSRGSGVVGLVVALVVIAAIGGGVLYGVRSIKTASTTISQGITRSATPTTDEAFGSTPAPTVPVLAPGQTNGKVDIFKRAPGTVTLSGAVTYTGATQIFTGTFDDKPCAIRAAATRLASVSLKLSTGEMLTVSAVITGGQGVGVYSGEKLIASATRPDPDGIDAGNQTWTKQKASTATLTINADGSGSYTFANLVPINPKAPHAMPLSGSMTWTCS